MTDKLSPLQDAIVTGSAIANNGPHNPDDRGPLGEALWAGVLAVGDAEAFQVDNHGTSRTTAHYSNGPGLQGASAVFSFYRDDGTRLHRRVTVTVIEEEDSDDAYWTQLAPGDAGAVRTTDGRHYIIGQTRAGDRNEWKGFGGHKWHVKFHDGRSVYTDNLWSQGVIPPKHRERLAPNAELHSYGHSDCCRDEPM